MKNEETSWNNLSRCLFTKLKKRLIIKQAVLARIDISVLQLREPEMLPKSSELTKLFVGQGLFLLMTVAVSSFYCS
jgi:hypothetical protein